MGIKVMIVNDELDWYFNNFWTATNEKSHFDMSISFRLITHAKQLLEDNEETLCVRVLQTIKGMMARDIDFGEKVRNKKAVMFIVLYVHAYTLMRLPLSTQGQLLIYSLDAHEFNPLSPKSDQHEISPYNINSLENGGHENWVHDQGRWG